MKYICTFFLLSYSLLFGQTEIDSLKNLLEYHTAADTVRINLLNRIAYELYQIDNEKSFKYAKEAGTLSEMKNYKEGFAESLRLTGNYYWMQSDYPKALEYYQKSMQIFYETTNTRGLALSYNNMGIISYLQGNFPKALDYYQKSLEINKKTNNLSQMSKIYNNIGIIYTSQGNNNKALEYYQESNEMNKLTGDSAGMAIAYQNIGIVYAAEKDYSKALDHYQKALKIHEKQSNKRGISNIYVNIGYAYMEKNDSIEATNYFEKSMLINNEIGSKSLEAWCYLGYAELFIRQQQNDEAYQYSIKSYNIANDIGEAELIKISSEILSKSSADMGLHQDAYEYLLTFKTLSDSLHKEEISRKLISWEYEYKHEQEQELLKAEQEKRDAVHAAELKRQRHVRNILFASTSLILLASIFLFYLYRSKKKANIIIRLQQDKLREINNYQQKLLNELKESNASKDKFFSIIAHDIKNPLQTLLSGSRLLSKRINHFDQKTIQEIAAGMRLKTENLFELLENLLNWARIQMGKISVEPTELNLFNLARKSINVFKDNAENKKITIQNKIDQSINVYADKMMTESVIQNLLTNAIKFTEKGGKIELSAEMNDGAVQITIKDNGVGIDKERADRLFNLQETVTTRGTADEKGTGLGLILCREFVEKNTGKIWIESKENSGTSVHFTLPAAQDQNNI